ncbi:MAG: SDR family oxidoreductase, partial [Planctomycetota bacterium]|nr:SDR family oxidoreductase [Planctomycetota bacterium]
MRPRRLRAPGEDGAVLADPPLGEAATLATANRARLDAWDHDFQGRRRSWLAVCARTRLLETARRHHDKFGLDLPATPLPDPSATPFVVTGHQPELFHPGVWVKNFATDALAGALGGAGVNLIVDNDIAKTAAIRVPTRNGEEIRAVRAEFDAWEGDAPYNASKAGLIMLTQTTALDYAKKGIRCNAICPAVIGTDMTWNFIKAQDDPEAAEEEFRGLHPMHVLGRPVDVANAALYLA